MEAVYCSTVLHREHGGLQAIYLFREPLRQRLAGADIVNLHAPRLRHLLAFSASGIIPSSPSPPLRLLWPPPYPPSHLTTCPENEYCLGSIWSQTLQVGRGLAHSPAWAPSRPQSFNTQALHTITTHPAPGCHVKCRGGIRFFCNQRRRSGGECHRVWGPLAQTGRGISWAGEHHLVSFGCPHSFSCVGGGGV